MVKRINKIAETPKVCSKCSLKYDCTYDGYDGICETCILLQYKASYCSNCNKKTGWLNTPYITINEHQCLSCGKIQMLL